ncbi:hypothetical protein BDZ94DRAFT_1244474 [Collybia nuda]|uniref:Uncharacterized protein n=1 Tax=Collybia nuda TaxID=64659 RepID=A0A9P5YGD5_9AGAR|nr:hypothetical protein BDZ94DRAFT_1244474 [Collybia nuda]
MSVSCNTFPTLTSTDVITTQSVSTSTSTSVTTNPPTVITSTTVLPCTAPLGVTSTCIPTTSTTLITQPGEIVTTEVPVTVPVDITSTRLATLFGTSCTTINKPADPTPPPYTPPPPPIITSSSTQPNGQVIIVTKTETSIQTSGQPTSVQPPNNSDEQTNLAPIIGGVVGGFFGLIAIVALIWFILKRRRRWDDIFEKEDDDIAPPVGPARRHGRFSLDVDVEPKPYQYGLVGHATAPGPVSPPNSPPLLASIPVGSESQNSHHNRHRSSLTPLNLPTTVSSPGLSATTISSRPSTGGSTHPLRPPSQQGYFSGQPTQPQPRPVDFGRAATSTTTHSHTQSTASYTSPSIYSGATHAIGMSMVSNSEDHPYTNRSGSPMSMQEQRILQVTNAPALSPQSETFQYADSLVSSSAASEAATSAVPQRDGKGRLRTSTGKAPLVHLDGGRIQQELEAGSSSGMRPPGAAPPAYEA